MMLPVMRFNQKKLSDVLKQLPQTYDILTLYPNTSTRPFDKWTLFNWYHIALHNCR